MKSLALLGALAIVACSLVLITTRSTGAHTPGSPLLHDLDHYLADRAAEASQIPSERRIMLDALADHIRETRAADKPVRLNFVCTHNSRRSHMSQLFMAAAAIRHGMDWGREIECYSGGTESTAFNPRAVRALRDAGFEIHQTTNTSNPIYHVKLGENMPMLTNFSKKYDTAPNPKESFVAVMVCGEADESCPNVVGADARFAITYNDPKAFDDTPREAEAYAERARQIAREFEYVAARATR
ncbi:MAG: protein-tyrosine-phosphatase [Planctomycetota bacterium]